MTGNSFMISDNNLWKVHAAKNYVSWSKTEFVSEYTSLYNKVISMRTVQDPSVQRIVITDNEIRYNVEWVSSMDYLIIRAYLFALWRSHFKLRS